MIDEIKGLEQLKNLKALYLECNRISKIEGLKELDLDENQIKVIEGLEGTKKLKLLSLTGNPITKLKN